MIGEREVRIPREPLLRRLGILDPVQPEVPQLRPLVRLPRHQVPARAEQHTVGLHQPQLAAIAEAQAERTRAAPAPRPPPCRRRSPPSAPDARRRHAPPASPRHPPPPAAHRARAAPPAAGRAGSRDAPPARCRRRSAAAPPPSPAPRAPPPRRAAAVPAASPASSSAAGDPDPPSPPPHGGMRRPSACTILCAVRWLTPKASMTSSSVTPRCRDVARSARRNSSVALEKAMSILALQLTDAPTLPYADAAVQNSPPTATRNFATLRRNLSPRVAASRLGCFSGHARTRSMPLP